MSNNSSNCEKQKKRLFIIAGIVREKVNELNSCSVKRLFSAIEIKNKEKEINQLLENYNKELRGCCNNQNAILNDVVSSMHGGLFADVELSNDEKECLLLGHLFPHLRKGAIEAITSASNSFKQQWKNKKIEELKNIVAKITPKIVKEVVPPHVSYFDRVNNFVVTKNEQSSVLFGKNMTKQPSNKFIGAILGCDSGHLQVKDLELSMKELCARVFCAVESFWSQFKKKFVDVKPENKGTNDPKNDFFRKFHDEEHGAAWQVKKTSEVTLTEDHWEQLADSAKLFSQTLKQNVDYHVVRKPQNKENKTGKPQNKENHSGKALGAVTIHKDICDEEFYETFKKHMSELTFARCHYENQQSGQSNARLVRFVSKESSCVQIKRDRQTWFLQSVPPTPLELEVIEDMNQREKLRHDSSCHELRQGDMSDDEACATVGEFGPVTGLFCTLSPLDGNDVGHPLHQDCSVFFVDDRDESKDLKLRRENLKKGQSVPPDKLMQHMTVQTWVLQNVEEGLANLVVT